MKYTITVTNEQGATEQHTANTKSGIDRWLASWHDPENFTARVVDENGELFAEKITGPKKLTWLYGAVSRELAKRWRRH